MVTHIRPALETTRTPQAKFVFSINWKELTPALETDLDDYFPAKSVDANQQACYQMIAVLGWITARTSPRTLPRPNWRNNTVNFATKSQR